MKKTFEDYLKEDKTLTMEEMKHLHEELVAEMGEDEDALELYGELMESAIRYANIRAKWTWMTREERMDIDSLRTSCHDSVINYFNILFPRMCTSSIAQNAGRSGLSKDVVVNLT